MSRFKFFEDQVESEASSPGVELKLHANDQLNARFAVKNHVCFYAMDQKVSDVRTDMVWLLKSIEDHPEGKIVDLGIESHEVFNANPALKEMIDFAKAFNYPMEKLVLQLDEQSRVAAVLNQQEIWERWNDIKEDVLEPLKASDQDRAVLENGDKQFSSSLEAIKESLSYMLFFGPVCAKMSPSEEMLLAGGKVASQLFAGNHIPFQLKVTCLESGKENISFKHQAQIDPYAVADFSKLYKKMYSELCGSTFDYEATLSATYSYAFSSGLINECTAVFSEKANKGLRYESNYQIKMI